MGLDVRTQAIFYFPRDSSRFQAPRSWLNPRVPTMETPKKVEMAISPVVNATLYLPLLWAKHENGIPFLSDSRSAPRK